MQHNTTHMTDTSLRNNLKVLNEQNCSDNGAHIFLNFLNSRTGDEGDDREWGQCGGGGNTVLCFN